MASYSFNLAEAEAFVRLHPDKSDYLDFNGDVKEDLNCSLFHYDLLIFGCRTIGSLSIISPSVISKKTSIRLGTDARFICQISYHNDLVQR